MIVGKCPNCDATTINYYGGSGVVEKCNCKECKKDYWLIHSNIDPVAYSTEGFLEAFEINEETKTIKKRETKEFL